MSYTADHTFIPDDPESIRAWLSDAYREITGSAPRPASPEMLFLQWLTSALTLERALANYAANQNIPSRAIGENLDALAELFCAQKRPQAQAASCTVRFHISQPQPFAVLVPQRTRVTDSAKTLVWETLEDTYVPAGNSYADCKVTCQTPGIIGNGFVPGQINAIIDPFAYFLSCENITASDGGADAASDTEFYELLRLSMDGFSCAGATGGYLYFAKQVSTEIADVAAVSPSPATVKLYVLMHGGKPAGDEIKNAVLNACSADSVRPLTDLVSVDDPEIVPYDISLTYYLPAGGNQSAASVAAQVDAAVKTFQDWQCARLGRDINPSYLVSLLMNTGIKRVELTAPVFTKLRDGKNGGVPQIAAIRDISVQNGGFEDD